MPLSPLPVEFYQQPVVDVARALLGMRLVRYLDEGSKTVRLSGIISETEAYDGESDLACHARAGRTPRTETMYGSPGRAYIYFIYGMHWMLNAVAEPEGIPTAVLIRAMLPEEGLEEIEQRRKGAPWRDWTSGPAKLCKALGIDGTLNGTDLTNPAGPLWIAHSNPVPEQVVITGPRVGIDRVPEPWRSKPWRFRIHLQSWNPPQGVNGV
jgi:DNA-3-methyladenine glycosylase